MYYSPCKFPFNNLKASILRIYIPQKDKNFSSGGLVRKQLSVVFILEDKQSMVSL